MTVVPSASDAMVILSSGVGDGVCAVVTDLNMPRMDGYELIAAMRTHRYARTGRDGSFRMESVPAGEYRLKIWHERAREENLKALERTSAVGAEDIALPVVSISESGYLEVPHLNKYGKEYPEREADHVIYPGGRK